MKGITLIGCVGLGICCVFSFAIVGAFVATSSSTQSFLNSIFATATPSPTPTPHATPTQTCNAKQYIDQVLPLFQNFGIQVKKVTFPLSPNALNTVSDMKEIRRNVAQIVTTKCVEGLHQSILEAVDAVIDALLYTINSGATTEATRRARDAATKWQLVEIEIDKLSRQYR